MLDGPCKADVFFGLDRYVLIHGHCTYIMPVMQYPTSLTKSIGRYRHLIGFSREQKRLITDNLVTRYTLRFRPDIPGSCVPDNHGQGFRGVIASATTDILAGARFH